MAALLFCVIRCFLLHYFFEKCGNDYQTHAGFHICGAFQTPNTAFRSGRLNSKARYCRRREDSVSSFAAIS